MAKKIVETKVIETEDISSDTKEETLITPEPHISTPVLKRQFELSDDDLATLARGSYSETAWELIGRKHRIDPTTKEQVGERAYIAVPKKWPDLTPLRGVPVTTTNIGDPTLGIAPMSAANNIAGVRASLLKRDLTKPVSEETHEEEV